MLELQDMKWQIMKSVKFYMSSKARSVDHTHAMVVRSRAKIRYVGIVSQEMANDEVHWKN